MKVVGESLAVGGRIVSIDPTGQSTKKVFVPFTIPGEIAEVTVTKDGGSFQEADLVSVLEPFHPQRVTPPCPVFTECGGCQLQHMTIEHERALKLQMIETYFARQTSLGDVTVISASEGLPEYHYRRRITLHLASDSVTGVERSYHISANVVSDSCNERLSDVSQDFSVVHTTSGLAINTSAVTIPVQTSGDSIDGSFSEGDEDCTRTYTARLGSWQSDAPAVSLTLDSVCGTRTCQTKWEGTNSGSVTRIANTERELRISGENCNANVPSSVGYRPSLFECNGNSAVLMRGSQRQNFSVVVRINGQFNDRDPANPSCESNRCSPYKTQKKLELPDAQINCLGASGYSSNFTGVQRISIKYVGFISDKNNPSQFEQYCVTNKTASFN